MASNRTQNYNLNQWELTDGIIMEDFNKDNRALDAALTEMQASIPRIRTGTYVGTNTFGEETPNSLTFDFEPKLVIVRKVSGSMQGDLGNELFFWTKGTSSDSVSTSTRRYYTLEGNTLSWYAKGTYASAAWQMNNPDTYCYMAIG